MASPPQLHLRNQICHALYSASLALTRAYRPLLEPLGLTYPQYLVMLALWEEEPLSVGQLCERSRLETGTVTPLLQRLEAKGLIVRGRSADDERRREISLTPAGQAMQKEAEEIPLKMACLAVIPPEEALALKQIAENLYQKLHDLEEAAGNGQPPRKASARP